MQIILNGYGEYLGTKNNKSLAIFNNGEMKKQIPFYNVDEVYLMDGNSCSTDALTLCALYDVTVFLLSHTGKILSVNLPFNENSESRVKTRIAQYESSQSEKGTEIAKSILLSKINNQKSLLEKYNHTFDSEFIEKKINKIEGKLTCDIRTKLNGFEGKFSELYFTKYFNLLPKVFIPDKRLGYKAQDKTNNLLNLGYEILSGEIYKSIILSHLDPYLGFLHSEQYLKPSLICDLQELFRFIVDEFLISYILQLDPKDSFEMEGKKPYLIPIEMKKFIIEVSKIFDKTIEHQRIKKYGKKSTIRTIIKEEPIKLAQYLRDEKPDYTSFTFNNYQ